jgi:hypothetical protein
VGSAGASPTALKLSDGADASRRAIGLRIAIRLLTVASRRSIKRLQQTVDHTSKLVRPPAADPQPRSAVE